jgi:hypothetical protein
MIKYFGKVLAIFVVLDIATNIYAFDGQRKGFVIGFGLGGGFGYEFAKHWSIEFFCNHSEHSWLLEIN